jgi:hypothetical protein
MKLKLCWETDSLSREDWLQTDKEDVALIEEQERFLEGDL